LIDLPDAAADPAIGQIGNRVGIGTLLIILIDEDGACKAGFEFIPP